MKEYVGDETYRPVRHKKHIYFTRHTKLETDSYGGLKIEKYAFDLFYLGEMKKLAEDNRYLIGKLNISVKKILLGKALLLLPKQIIMRFCFPDVAGRIQNVRPNMKSTKNDVEKRLTKFDVFDGRYMKKQHTHYKNEVEIIMI